LVLAVDLVLMGILEANGAERPFLTPQPLHPRNEQTDELVRLFRQHGGRFRCCDLRQLADRHIRGHGLGSHYGNHNIVFGYYDSGGYDSIPPPRIVRLLRFPSTELSRAVVRDSFPMMARALQLTSARYFAGRAEPGGPRDAVHEVRDCLPRVKLFTRYSVERNPERALATLFEEGFDYLSTVVLDREPELPISAEEPEGQVQIQTEGFNRLDLEVRSSGNSILLLNDTHVPGWRATVNGRPVDILMANSAFRAVVVPAGNHVVSFRFRHGGMKTGTLLTCLGLAILGSLAIACLKGLWRRRPGNRPAA
jgi:hypothetical protein